MVLKQLRGFIIFFFSIELKSCFSFLPILNMDFVLKVVLSFTSVPPNTVLPVDDCRI